jgi:hypothetical protein
VDARAAGTQSVSNVMQRQKRQGRELGRLRGLGAGIVARMMHLSATTSPAQLLALGKPAAAVTAAVEVEL